MGYKKGYKTILAMLDERMERLNNGEGIHKTMEELKAMEDE